MCNVVLRLESIKTISLSFVVAHVLFISFVMRADFLNYAGDIGGGGPNAKRIYYELSSQRETLSKIRVQNGITYRVWLTPDDDIQLVSSQMFAYSLISLQPGKADCSQVKWASSSQSLLATFEEGASLSELDNVYLRPCGFYLLALKNHRMRLDPTFNPTVGIITPLNP